MLGIADIMRYEVRLSATAQSARPPRRRHAMLADLARRDAVSLEGLTIQRESFESWYRDGRHLFAEHSTAVGEPPFSFETKNIPLFQALEGLGSLEILTGRSNGKMFGYLATVYGPSLEGQNMRTATQTAFYASPDMLGLGLKLPDPRRSLSVSDNVQAHDDLASRGAERFRAEDGLLFIDGSELSLTVRFTA